LDHRYRELPAIGGQLPHAPVVGVKIEHVERADGSYRDTG
jgi:hypothetical protein